MRSPTGPLLVALGVEPDPGLKPPPPGVGVRSPQIRDGRGHRKGGKVYTTKHPRERFNIRWNRRKSAFRLAARGLALYIYPGPLIEWSLVILVTLTAFRLGVIYAYLERGYQARGGEYLLLLIPPIYYAAKRTLLDWIADLRRAKGRRERSAESEYTL